DEVGWLLWRGRPGAEQLRQSPGRGSPAPALLRTASRRRRRLLPTARRRRTARGWSQTGGARIRTECERGYAVRVARGALARWRVRALRVARSVNRLTGGAP